MFFISLNYETCRHPVIEAGGPTPTAALDRPFTMPGFFVAQYRERLKESAFPMKQRPPALRHPDSFHLEAASDWLGLGDYLAANEELDQVEAKLRAHRKC